MREEPTWHAQAVEQLSQIFDKEPDARAFILSGSLTAATPQADAWSDVDVKIILAEHALDRYYMSTTWLSPFGRLIGSERHASPFVRTLRVCLEGFHRFDLVFIAESALQNPSLLTEHLFQPPYDVVWSRLPDLNKRIASLPLPAQYQDLSHEEIERIINTFWFKAASAITKVVRNDLLIGLHLALDLVRDGLVLQMIRRDRKKRTTIHRVGGWGNELVTHFSLKSGDRSDEEILHFVKLSCEVFDELATDLLPDYENRGPFLYPTIERAKEVCRHRSTSGECLTSKTTCHSE